MSIITIVESKFRDCDLQIQFNEGCVFADFVSVKQNGELVLKLCRISFDGYGCCDIGEDDCLTTIAETAAIKKFGLNSTTSESERRAVIGIFKDFFNRNKSIIWEDALRDNNLL